MPTAVVNSRVSVQDRDATSRILSRAGITMSEAIRAFVQRIAATGEIPDYVTSQADGGRDARVAAASAFLSRVESLPTPGYDPDVSDEEIVSRERMRRFG